MNTLLARLLLHPRVVENYDIVAFSYEMIFNGWGLTDRNKTRSNTKPSNSQCCSTTACDMCKQRYDKGIEQSWWYISAVYLVCGLYDYLNT